MSMVTAMDGIGDINRVDTVHDNVSEEYKQTVEKAMTNKETVDEATMKMPQVPQGPMDIWLQFDTISVGAVGKERHTFDLVKILKGLERLADSLPLITNASDKVEE